jgi:DNA-binding transcriptional MerR regulator/methylmalonyl-CoA mutase cobalamin-binding subunit
MIAIGAPVALVAGLATLCAPHLTCVSWFCPVQVLDELRMALQTTGHSISVASRLSGVPIETLRAWERRYGFPRPARKDGTQRRLYSEKDIARLRCVVRALGQGFRAGDVVRRRPEEIEALLAEAAPVAAAVVAPTSLPTVDQLVETLVADDVTSFDSALRRLAGALGPRAFVTDVAHPLAVAVGDAWESGKLEVRQEHYASEALETQLRLALGGLQDVQGAPVIVLATLPGETHGLGLAMVALYAALSGAKPRILGTCTPVDQIAAAARALDADAVGLTITPASVTTELRAQVRALERSLPRRARLWLGGAGAERVPASRAHDVVRDWLSLDGAIERARR